MDILEQTGRGTDFFGLTHPVIQNLIQSSPGAKRCTNYKWVKFEISKTDTNESVDTDMLQDPTIGYDACRVALIKGQSLFPYFLLLFIVSLISTLCISIIPVSTQSKGKLYTIYAFVLICSRVFYYLSVFYITNASLCDIDSILYFYWKYSINNCCLMENYRYTFVNTCKNISSPFPLYKDVRYIF